MTGDDAGPKRAVVGRREPRDPRKESAEGRRVGVADDARDRRDALAGFERPLRGFDLHPLNDFRAEFPVD